MESLTLSGKCQVHRLGKQNTSEGLKEVHTLFRLYKWKEKELQTDFIHEQCDTGKDHAMGTHSLQLTLTGLQHPEVTSSA